MNKTIFIIFMFVILVACSTPITERVSPNYEIKVVSLREKYLVLQEIAQGWDSEAYLRSVEIPIFERDEENYLWLVKATFQSPSKTHETLAVTLEIDGHVSHRIFSHTTDVYQITPINLEEWQIDSPDALVYFQNLDISDLSIPDGATSLFLERILSEKDQPLVWRLSTNMGINGQHYYIDPVHGTMLQFSR